MNLDMGPDSSPVRNILELEMKIDELVVSDGNIIGLNSQPGKLSLSFRSWDEKYWLIQFEDVIAFECIGAEGEDLDSIRVASSGSFKDRVSRVAIDEDLTNHQLYEFFSAWQEIPLLSVVSRFVVVSPDNYS